MKKIGIVGGLGPASTIDYYREIIEIYRNAKGEDVYPEIVIDSVNMGELVGAIKDGALDAVAAQLMKSISNLKAAGADFGAIASNSPHIVWDMMKDNMPIPMISITEAVSDYIAEKGYKKVLILATEFTMRNGLYSRVLTEKGIDWVLPDEEDITILGNIIYPNLENAIVIYEDKLKMIAIAEKYIKECGADSVLLGCTEIPLMIKQGDVSVSVINSTEIHIAKICDTLLKDS